MPEPSRSRRPAKAARRRQLAEAPHLIYANGLLPQLQTGMQSSAPGLSLPRRLFAPYSPVKWML